MVAASALIISAVLVVTLTDGKDNPEINTDIPPADDEPTPDTNTDTDTGDDTTPSGDDEVPADDDVPEVPDDEEEDQDDVPDDASDEKKHGLERALEVHMRNMAKKGFTLQNAGEQHGLMKSTLKLQENLDKQQERMEAKLDAGHVNNGQGNNK